MIRVKKQVTAQQMGLDEGQHVIPPLQQVALGSGQQPITFPVPSSQQVDLGGQQLRALLEQQTPFFVGQHKSSVLFCLQHGKPIRSQELG